MRKLFCMSLKTGGIAIGWLGVVGSFLGSIIMIVTLINFGGQVEKLNERATVISICSVFLGLCLISLLSSVLLIVGTIKDRHLMLLPWLILGAFDLAAAGVRVFAAILASFSRGSPMATCLTILFASAAFAFELYIYIAIRSLYKEIRAKQLSNSTPTELNGKKYLLF